MLTLERDCLRITETVYQSILRDLGGQPLECGGILGADQSGVVSAWYFDRTGKSSHNSYKPDVIAINRVLQEEWQPSGIYMLGIAHSHTAGKNVPSCGDIHYGIRILEALDTTDTFYLPILELSETRQTLFAFILYKNSQEQYQCRQITCQISCSKRHM